MKSSISGSGVTIFSNPTRAGDKAFDLATVGSINSGAGLGTWIKIAIQLIITAISPDALWIYDTQLAKYTQLVGGWTIESNNEVDGAIVRIDNDPIYIDYHFKMEDKYAW
jgi:hypothetical protein